MNDQERQAELRRLEITLEEIEKQLLVSEKNCDIQDAELRTTLQNYWDYGGSNAVDEAQLVETVDRQRALTSVSHGTSLKLRKMIDSPYFGRIDFIEEATDYQEPVEQIYIGISTLTDKETGEFLVYDWRAPVSGMFYDFGLGKAWYNCPAGIINGSITLKRQYKITNKHMEYMFNADWKIDDEVLQEILGKSADDKMHTIVNSIQREQNQIVRDEIHRALFVEGPAGSGKTSVALHRIAFLLYRDRNSITSKNVLILSPNHLFSDYVSNVLPELGEENVPQMTFQDYVSQSAAGLSIQFETRSAHLESIFANPNDAESDIRAAGIRFKSSGIFDQALQEYLNWIQTSLINAYPDIEVQGQVIFTKEDWKHYYLDSYSTMPVTLRLEKIRELIQIRMRPFVHALREEKEAALIAGDEEVNEKVIKALARIQARQQLQPLVDKIDRLTSLNPLDEYRRLLSKNSRLTQFLSNKLPDRWHAIRKQTLAFMSEGILPYEDIPPFLYFQGVLQGFAAKSDIKHLVIDEAQDYTSLQYKIMVKLFPNSSWTVVGDPAQTLHPFLHSASFTTASKIINVENLFMVRLTRSYRSTKQIQDFCQSLLPYKTEVEPINRPGPLPTVSHAEAPEELSAMLIKTIKHHLAEGWNSIGIICKSTAESEMLFTTLKDHLRHLQLVTSEDDQFPRGIVIMPSYLAKGLEFDAVLVINADEINYSRTEERHILYTICTRALHRLHLFYKGTPSPFIAQMDTTLYQVVSNSELTK